MEDTLQIALKFAQTVSPVGIIAILAIIIFQLVNGKNIISVFRGDSNDSQDTVQNAENFEQIDFRILNAKLDTLASNHLHELPDIAEAIRRMEIKQDKMNDILIRIEAKI